MRAKSHDQRKGQWLINKIRSNPKFPKLSKQEIKGMSLEEMITFEKKAIEIRLWNMENEEFDRLMGDYND